MYTYACMYGYIYVNILCLQKVSGFRWYNLQEMLLGLNKCIVITFVTLGMRLEGNALKSGERTVGFSFTITIHCTSWFWSRSFSK